MTAAFLHKADDILRGRPWTVESARTGRAVLLFLAFVAIFGLFYGAVMGAYGGFRGERLLQVVYSASKVPLLLLVTFVISLPSFFVLNTLLGLRPDFVRVFRALLATQAALTILLASLSPLTALWYLSWDRYQAAILFNGLMFGVASFGAQRLLRRYYQPLILKDRAHRLMLRVWLIIYAFVGIQMGWVLRPFIGSPEQPVQFFRHGAWGNAYMEVIQIAMSLITKR